MKKDDEKIVQQIFESYFTKNEKYKKDEVIKLIKISELYARKQWEVMYVRQMYDCFKRMLKKDSFMLMDLLLQKQWRQNKQNGYKLAISQSIVEYYTFIFPLIFEYRHQDLIIDFKTYRMLWVKFISDQAFDQLRIQIKKIYKHIDLNKGFTTIIMDKINKSFQRKRLSQQQIQRYMSNHQIQHNSRSRQRDLSQDEQHYNSKKKIKYDPLVNQSNHNFQINKAINPQLNQFPYNDHTFTNSIFNPNHNPYIPNYNMNAYPNRSNVQINHHYLNPLNNSQKNSGMKTNYFANNSSYQNVGQANMNNVNRQTSNIRNPNIHYTNLPSNPLTNPQINHLSHLHQKNEEKQLLFNETKRQNASLNSYQEYNNPTYMPNKFNNSKSNMKMYPPMLSPSPSSNSHHSPNLQLRQPHNIMKERQEADNGNYYNVGSPPNYHTIVNPLTYKQQPQKSPQDSYKLCIQKQRYMQILTNLKKNFFECRECGIRFLTRQNLQKHQYEHFFEAQRRFMIKQGQNGSNTIGIRKQRLQNCDMLFDVNQWIMSSDDKQDLTNCKVSINRLTDLDIANFSHHCFYCNEQLRMSWCDKLQQWCLQQSVKVKEEYLGLHVAHVNCYECFKEDDNLQQKAIL